MLAHGIAEGQWFVEGNKLTALAAMRTFLLLNGFQTTASQEERGSWILDLSEAAKTADEKISKLAQRIRLGTRPADKG